MSEDQVKNLKCWDRISWDQPGNRHEHGSVVSLSVEDVFGELPSAKVVWDNLEIPTETYSGQQMVSDFMMASEVYGLPSWAIYLTPTL